MLQWEKRPIEVANLLNPAFCAVLLYQTVAGFQREMALGLPYATSFLVLPIILHKPTRDALPTKIITKHHAWLEKHQQIRVGFAERARQMVPYTKEALTFAISQHIITFKDACLGIGETTLKINPKSNNSEVELCQRRAEFLGRWLAHAGEPMTTFLMWGISP